MSFLNSCFKPNVAAGDSGGELAILPRHMEASDAAQIRAFMRQQQNQLANRQLMMEPHNHQYNRIYRQDGPSTNQRRLFPFENNNALMGSSRQIAFGHHPNRLALEEEGVGSPCFSPLGYTVESPPSVSIPLNSFGDYCHHQHARPGRFQLSDGGTPCQRCVSESELSLFHPVLLESATGSAQDSSPRLSVKNQPVISLKKSKSAEKAKANTSPSRSNEVKQTSRGMHLLPPAGNGENPTTPVSREHSQPQQQQQQSFADDRDNASTMSAHLFSAMVNALNRIEMHLHEARHGGAAVEQWAKIQLERDAIKLQNDHLRYLLNASKSRSEARKVVQEWLHQDGDRDLLGQILFDAMTECLVDSPVKPIWVPPTGGTLGDSLHQNNKLDIQNGGLYARLQT